MEHVELLIMQFAQGILDTVNDEKSSLRNIPSRIMLSNTELTPTETKVYFHT